MDSVIVVLLHAGYIIFSLIFFSSAVVSLITYLKIGKNEKANKVWLSKKWLMVLFFGFGVPCVALGIVLWNRGEGNVVLVTGIIMAALGVVLGLKAEERLRYERY
ncbi:MAG: hypothetical protein JXK94_01945 [Deltaproteobacteria bacterium]|nr:hypothetical protein [Deltaproteobacteria bacterium]